MTSLSSALDVGPVHKRLAGHDLRLTDYFGVSMDMSIGGPPSHLVEPQNPNHVIKPHFHVRDQFQLFVHTTGRIGSHPITTNFVAHYADAYTPYGPVTASTGTLKFVTLRILPDPGPWHISRPEARAKRRGRGGRYIVQDIPDEGTVAAGQVEILVGCDDGVCIGRLEIGPGGAGVGVEPVPGASYYYIVVEGAVQDGGRDHPALTHVFVAPGESAPRFHASEVGATLVVFGFRQPAPDPDEDAN